MPAGLQHIPIDATVTKSPSHQPSPKQLLGIATCAAILMANCSRFRRCPSTHLGRGVERCALAHRDVGLLPVVAQAAAQPKVAHLRGAG
jgi:hypothetical protein